MDSFEAKKAQVRDEFFQQFGAIERLFTEEYTKRLSESESYVRKILLSGDADGFGTACGTLISGEQRSLCELDVLGERAAKVDILESENRKLAAELILASGKAHEHIVKPSGVRNLEKKDGQEPDVKMVAIEEYNRVNDLLEKSRKDYGRLVEAHRFVESQARSYKERVLSCKKSLKEWEAYCDRWKSRRKSEAAKRMKPNAMDISPTLSARDPRSPSGSAPPSLPDGLALSISDTSRSTSPWISSARARARPEESDLKTGLRDEGIVNTIINANDVDKIDLTNGNGLNSDDATEASEDSDPRTNMAEPANGYKDSSQAGPKVASPILDDSDQPVFVSERSLKRKRPTIADEDTDKPKRPLIKSETLSSSPVPNTSSLRFEVPHDSLDLDDISGHVVTPRKQRLHENKTPKVSARSPSKRLFQTHNTFGNERALLPQHDLPNPCSPHAMKIQTHSPDRANDRDEHGEEYDLKRHRSLRRQPQQAHNDRIYQRLSASPQIREPSRSSNAFTPSKYNAQHDNSVYPRNDHSSSGLDKRRMFEILRTPMAAESPTSGVASPSILRPMDTNARALPRTNDSAEKHKRSCQPSRQDRGAAAVPEIAEDGEHSTHANGKIWPSSVEINVSDKEAFRAPDAPHRLQTLLTEPSLEKVILEPQEKNPILYKTESPKKTPLARQAQPSMAAPFTAPTRKAIANSDLGNRSNMTATKRITPSEDRERRSMHNISDKGKAKPFPQGSIQEGTVPDEAAAPQPEEEPLRSRPIHRLNLHDFKLNPVHGDYAYQESVRKHDEKSAISGCTNKNCLRCGDTVKFMENSGYAPSLPGETPAATEKRLIENYLGEDGKARLKRMDAREREEVLTKAKQQQFADKFGKHKTRFGREPSPVDFWNVGFPSTQEECRNRELTRVREREKVEERYWEAIRQGGRWVFADEVQRSKGREVKSGG